MQIKTFTANYFSGNCYLITNERKCIIVDPAVDYHTVFDNSNLELVGVFITHGHFDHINCLDSYLLNSDAKIYMHSNCLEKINDPMKNCSNLINENIKFIVPEERITFINDESDFSILNHQVKIIETPGHTNCSVCIILDNYLFSGDTLFAGAIGRVDLYSSNSTDIINSLEKLKNLKTNYQVFPGHGQTTYLDFEKKVNPYLIR